jgi:predicted DsbA family dithiol-disulfide isomerase
VPTRIDAWMDFACPFCFFSSLGLERLEKSHAVEIHRRAYMLRPPEAPPIRPEVRSVVAEEHKRVAKMVRDEYAMELHAGEIGVKTYRAHLACQWAQAGGKGSAFHAAVMKAYWLDCRAIDDLKVLGEIAGTAGMDAKGLSAAIKDPAYATAIAADARLAGEHEIHGVPAMVFADQFMFRGALTYPKLAKILKQVESKTAASKTGSQD